jgi:hypothetical protein
MRVVMKLTTSDLRHGAFRSMVAVAIIVMLIIVRGSGTSATAGNQQDFVFELPAGSACLGFDLRIEGTGGNQVVKEFVDRNGNVVRALSAGTGSALSFTNLSTGATFSLRSNGAVSHTTVNPDESSTVTITGHNVLILFPTDVPAGPSTTLHVGLVVYTIDANEVFTVEQVSGQTTDICAVLSQ